MQDDPYRITAGAELDEVIHGRVMEKAVGARIYPAYSTDDKVAKQLLSRIRTGKTRVVVGRTSLVGRTWFARYEGNAMDGTEVFADTFALAICRLALLRLEDTKTGK